MKSVLLWTGAYAGAGIQYMIPVSLVWLARRSYPASGSDQPHFRQTTQTESYLQSTVPKFSDRESPSLDDTGSFN
jgi:hypothetical protein